MDQEDPDGPPFVMRGSVRTAVVELIDQDGCKKCLHGRVAGIETFITTIASLTPDEKKLCIFTSLAILDVADDAQPTRVRSRGERRRFHYYAPFIGRVCQKAFIKLFGISVVTLARYKEKVRRGWLVDK